MRKVIYSYQFCINKGVELLKCLPSPTPPLFAEGPWKIIERFVINNCEEVCHLFKVAYKKICEAIFKPTTHFQVFGSVTNITWTILFKNRFRKLKTNQTSLKILCKWSVYNCATLSNELENIHFKETGIFRISGTSFSTCIYIKHRFFLVFDYTGSAMKNSACNFRQKFNDFQKSGLLFSEKKT